MRKSRRRPVTYAPAAKGWRLAAVLFALVTFAIQGYVTQTHVHFDPPPGWSGKNLDLDTTEKAPQGKYPFKETPANCPICQEVAMAGHYVTPTAIVFVLPAQSVAIIPIVVSAPFIVEAVSHDWRGRAPPHA